MKLEKYEKENWVVSIDSLLVQISLLAYYEEITFFNNLRNKI